MNRSRVALSGGSYGRLYLERLYICVWVEASVGGGFLCGTALGIIGILFPVVAVPCIDHVLKMRRVNIFSFMIAVIDCFSLFTTLKVPLCKAHRVTGIVKSGLGLGGLFGRLFSVGIVSSVFFAIIFYVSVGIVPVFVRGEACLFVSKVSLCFYTLGVS